MEKFEHIQSQAQGLELFSIQFETSPEAVRFLLRFEIPLRHQWSVKWIFSVVIDDQSLVSTEKKAETEEKEGSIQSVDFGKAPGTRFQAEIPDKDDIDFEEDELPPPSLVRSNSARTTRTTRSDSARSERERPSSRR